jgi:hypothetical protein
MLEIPASYENSGGCANFRRLMKILADAQNSGVSWKFRRMLKIPALMKIQAVQDTPNASLCMLP